MQRRVHPASLVGFTWVGVEKKPSALTAGLRANTNRMTVRVRAATRPQAHQASPQNVTELGMLTNERAPRCARAGSSGTGRRTQAGTAARIGPLLPGRSEWPLSCRRSTNRRTCGG